MGTSRNDTSASSFLDGDSLVASCSWTMELHFYNQPRGRFKFTYAQGNEHFGGLVFFSLPQGTVMNVFLQGQVTSTVSGQG